MTDKDYINENINPSVENRAQTEVFFFKLFRWSTSWNNYSKKISPFPCLRWPLWPSSIQKKKSLVSSFPNPVVLYIIPFTIRKPFYRLQQVQKTPKFTFGPTNRTFLHRLRVHLLSVNIKTPNTYVLVFFWLCCSMSWLVIPRLSMILILVMMSFIWSLALRTILSNYGA